ncbi:MAG: glutaminyl-peptide cyclotransferase [Bacteroidetes bacterium]|nr:glutaminyl-peptide cyclotransferase [Bacteroidota bacterium]
MTKAIRVLVVLLPIALLTSCSKKEAEPPRTETSAPKQASTPTYSYEIVATYPHDTKAFTEGLQYYNGELYESTGINGHSSLRRVELKSGKVLQSIDLPNQYFGEGIVIVGSKLYQLTYTSQIGFVYDLKTFKQISTWSYNGEGWALTTDGTSLIMSNGTDKLQFLDPNTLSVTRTVSVQESGMPLTYVNELEYIKGEVWANIWQTNRIVRIDPATGDVKGWIDLSGLLSPAEAQGVDVLNGIAYDAEHDRIFVTGKNWPKLFEIKIKSIS